MIVHDQDGRVIEPGTRVIGDPALPGGTVVCIGDTDVDTHGTVAVRWDDEEGVEIFHLSWDATGPWDDHVDTFTCEDIDVAKIQRVAGVPRLNGRRVAA